MNGPSVDTGTGNNGTSAYAAICNQLKIPAYGWL